MDLRKWFLLGLLSSMAAAQECTTYVVAAALDHTTGEELSDLTNQDFVARIGHTSVPVVSAERDFSNRLLVLVEADGAAEKDNIANIVQTAMRLSREAPQGKPIKFGLYSNRAIFSKSFSPDPKERTTEINDVIEDAGSLGEHVALYDALHEALEQFGPHQPGDTVLLVAEPFDDISKHSISTVEKEFTSSGTRLAIMLRQPLSRISRDFPWKTHQQEKDMFEELTGITGGSYTIFGPHIFRFPWKGYMLGLKLPAGINKPVHWKIDFRDRARVIGRHPKLYVPDQLVPCGDLKTSLQ